MDDPKKNDSPGTIDRTVIVSPVAGGKSGGNRTEEKPSHISNATSFLARHLFTRKRQIDDVLVSNKVSKYAEREITLSTVLETELKDIHEEYLSLEVFAEGGQAFVSIAKDKNLGRVTAVKSLKKEFLTDGAVLDDFLKEAQVTAQLDHPAIIPIYGLNKDKENGIHLAMKLINGKTLRDYLKNIVLNYRMKGIQAFDERDSLRKRLEIFLPVCDAVAFAHHKNIMHRDLKPENIMIGEYMEVYVMDWGIAKKIHEPEGDGRDDQLNPNVSGTPRYFSPEAVIGARCDERSDIFTLGLILQEIVTLQYATVGDTQQNLMENIRDGILAPVEHLFKARIDGDLKAIIRKATASDKADRYSSVTRLAEDLRHYMSGMEVSARPDDFFMKIARYAYHHRRLMLTGTLLILLGAASLTAVSIYDKLKLVEETSTRTHIMNSVYGQTASSAADFDMTALHIENKLAALAGELVYLFRFYHDGKDKNGTFYFYDGNNKVATPSDAVYSPYYKRLISLSHGIGKRSSDTPPESAERFIAKVSPLLPNLFHGLLESVPGQHLTRTTFPALQADLLKNGMPVKSFYIASPDGVHMGYPWRDVFHEKFDPRKRPWYQRALTGRGPVWGKPYIDTDGAEGLSIPCSMAVRGRDGTLHAVAGLDMSFNQLADRIMKTGNQGPHVLEKALVTQEGRIIVSTCSEFINRSFDPGNYENPEPEMPLFHDEELRKRILRSGKNSYGLLVRREKGKEILYSYIHLKIFDLFYVEMIDFSALLARQK